MNQFLKEILENCQNCSAVLCEGEIVKEKFYVCVLWKIIQHGFI